MEREKISPLQAHEEIDRRRYLDVIFGANVIRHNVKKVRDKDVSRTLNIITNTLVTMVQNHKNHILCFGEY